MRFPLATIIAKHRKPKKLRGHCLIVGPHDEQHESELESFSCQGRVAKGAHWAAVSRKVSLTLRIGIT